LLAEHYKDRIDEKSEKCIRYVLDGAKRMQQLIQDLLSYSRVDSQAALPVLINSEIVVRTALTNLKLAIEESHAEIDFDVLPAVQADAVQLTQVFQNLIGNALKFYDDRPPHIRIGAKLSDDKWVFHVEDNGIGIQKEYAERVFRMFQRLHERGRYEGSGIGLAIVKKIVERHGGRVWFESKPKIGITFYFTIPANAG
jgi:light-regulated signal transduction histidine kinase (bacteriophytochrome)